MTDQEFQKAVLQALGKIDTRLDSLDKRVGSLESFIEEQKKVNERQEVFNGKVIDFLQNQGAFNKKVETFQKDQMDFNEKLFVVVENEIVDRLAALSDESKAYTDTKVQVHEEAFQHMPSFV